MRRQFKSNNNIVYSCKCHVVWRPKYRRPVLKDGVDVRLKEVLFEVARERRAEIIELGLMPDHVHLLVKLMKGRSSRILRQEFPWLRSRLPTLWTNSYFVATVGGAPLASLREYIEQQKHV